MHGRCDFCREELNPPHAHYCADEYIARLGNSQDAVTVFLDAHKEFMKDQTSQANWDKLEKAIAALPYSGDAPRAKMYMHRAQLAIRVADAAFFHYMEGDATQLEAALIEWIEFRYKWDRPVGPEEELSETLRRCQKFLKMKGLYGDVARINRPKLAGMLTTCRDLLSKLTAFTGDLISERLQLVEASKDEQLP